MKTKRFFAGLSAFAIAAAMLPVSAFADNDPPATQTDITITQDTQPNTDGKREGSTTATYTVTSSYIVTIPSTAVINDEAAQTKQTTDIKVTEMKYMTGQKIVVKLDKGSNTTSGDEFTAKNGTSEIKYQIKSGDNALKAGDTVKEFEAVGDAALTLVKTGGTPNIAGTYTETLTFGVSVESAKAAAEKPDVAQADCTFSPSNGKSTLSNANITTAMEYSADNGTTWTDVTSDGSIASLAAGTVQIRVKETADKLASEAVSITVPEVLHFELVGPYTGDRLTCEYYAGETWQALVNRYDLIKTYSGIPRVYFGNDGGIYYKGSKVLVTDLVDNTKTYEVQ